MTDRTLGSLVVEDHGSGPAVLALHGLGGSSNTFEPLVPALDEFRLLRPDFPGSGRSGLQPGRAGIDGLVSVVLDVMRLTGVERAHVMGHSMGALVAQHLAASHPDRVSGLTLFGPLLAPSAAARAALRERAAAARAGGMADIASAVVRASVSGATTGTNPAAAAFVRESLLRQSPGGYARHCEWLADARPAAHASIVCPVMLVAGADDPVAPVTMVRELAGLIAGARMESLERVGHWMTLEASAHCRELLRASIEMRPRAHLDAH